MPQLFLLFSHTLTDEQAADAGDTLGVTEVVSLPPELQARWSNVPPEPESIAEHLQPVLDWLAQSATPGDYVLAQGDFGAVYHTVQSALARGLIPIYATTRRNVIETRLPDGKVHTQRVFDHVRFRKYEGGSERECC